MSGGDPGSTSALGGALRRHALALAEVVDELEPGRHAAHTGRADHCARERVLLGTAAGELDRVGALLQEWTSGAAQSLTRLRQLQGQLAAAGLVVEGSRVVESLGPSRVDPDERERSRVRLQELVNRVTAARAKDLGRLTRELETSRERLAGCSDQARSGEGPQRPTAPPR